MSLLDAAPRPGPVGRHLKHLRNLGHLRHDAVTRATANLMLSTIVSSALGYAFWLVVDHSSSAQVSGTGAATTSAVQATALIASVGAAAAMMEWLPRTTDNALWHRRITVGLMSAGCTALVGSIVVVIVLGAVTDALPSLGEPLGQLWFCVATVTYAVGTVIDYAALAERRSGLLLLRSILFNALRTPLLFLPVLVRHSPDSVLASFALSAAVSLVFGIVLFERSTGRSLRPVFGRVRVDARQMVHSLVGQHLITLAAMLSAYVLPVLVVARVSAADAAYFYSTWMLCAVFFMISPAVATALFAEGAAAPKMLPALVRRASILVAVVLVVPMAAYLVGGGLLLRLFGASYEQHGRTLLILLTISAIPDAMTNIAISILRATGRLTSALSMNVAMLVLCLATSWIFLPHYGIAAIGVAWLGSQTLGAVWVVVSWRALVAPVGRHSLHSMKVALG